MKRSLFVVLPLVITAAANADPIQFEDTSDKLGFERGTETWGIAWGNLNGDKWPDLWNSGHRDYPRLYRNTGSGDFDDVSAEYDAQMDDWWMILTQRDVHGGAWGDFDKDGDDDLIVGDEDEFFINHADSGGYFERSTLTSAQQFAAWVPSNGSTTLMSETVCREKYVQFIDSDNDGDLDKICSAAEAFPGNDSDTATGNIPVIGNVADTIVGDFNNDLLPDIVAIRGALHSIGAARVNNTSIDIWFRETIGAEVTFSSPGKVTFMIDGEGGGAFLQADVLNLDSNGNASGSARGIDVFYDTGDGLWHVQDVSSGTKNQHYIRVRAENPVSQPQMTGQESRDLPGPTAHAINDGNDFEWVYNTGLAVPVHCNSVTTADFDNDMDLDLYMACGIGVENTPNLYYDNQGDGTFKLVNAHGGEGPVGPGYDFGVAESVVAADYDVDGFVDLAISNGILFYPFGFGGPDTLLRNQGNGNHWIEIDLIGVTSNANGIGARVYVTAGGKTQLRVQNGGYHRWSQDHQRIHVGLAGNSAADEVRIEWPSGDVDVYTNVAADRLYDAIEDSWLQPAVLGSEVHTAIGTDEECGRPEYRITYGPVIQLWRDCGTENWHLRMRSGLGRMTEFASILTKGRIVGDSNFVAANGIQFDGSDVLTNENGVISFSVRVEDEVIPTKTINFSTAGQTSTCLSFDYREIEPVIIGAGGKRLDPPFDISRGFSPCQVDSDGDTIPDDVDPDDDNDGVVDVDDAFPLDPTEWADSDGDGVGDNSDAFPLDPAEWADSDGDGVGDNADNDLDNDGITDTAESPDGEPLDWLSPVLNIPSQGNDITHEVDLSALPVFVGDSISVNGLIADGDLNNSGEFFSLNFNSGEYATGNVTTEGRCVGELLPVTDTINATVTVTDIGGGVPGLSVFAQTTTDVQDSCSFDGVDFRFSLLVPTPLSPDQDSDGVANLFDLDSDNDGIADVVEAGLVDSDHNFLVDNPLTQQGTISNPLDSDADGIPDFLDLESHNPLNDGTDYDIDASGHGGLDTFRDGFLSAADVDGGTDLDADGIDDLIDLDNTTPGSTFNNIPPQAIDGSVVTSIDTPVSITLQATDANLDPLDFFVTQDPTNGQLTGTAPDLLYTPDAGFTGSDSLDFVANDGYGDSAPATVTINVNGSDVALVDWIANIGGVAVNGNQISYSGSPTGWLNNTVRSIALSELGFNDAYELKFTLESDPAGTLWVAGLGIDETNGDWRDVDYALRSSNGQLTVYENGSWRTNGPTLSQGDVISIFVEAGMIEYRHNGNAIYTSAYAGSPDFYVDTSFKSGAIQFSAVLSGAADPVTPPDESSITGWQGIAGGVSVDGNQLSYSGSPTGWSNSAYSVTLSSMGAGDDFEVSWTIDSDPANTLWIVGLGVTESSVRWNDVDYGMRSSNGQLTIYESGSWRFGGSALNEGDTLSIRVAGTTLEYLRNGAVVHSTTIVGSEDFYVDTAFKSGAIVLGSFSLLQ